MLLKYDKKSSLSILVDTVTWANGLMTPNKEQGKHILLFNY